MATSPIPMNDHQNQFEVLNDEGKIEDNSLRSRFGKDDIKEQAFQAKEAVKTKVIDLKEQVVNSNLYHTVTDSLEKGIEFAKEKAGIQKSNEELLADAQEKAAGGWEEVKRKGHKASKKAEQVINEKLDENLTPEQKRTLKSAGRTAKKLEHRAEGFANKFLNMTFNTPQLRPFKHFIQRNHLQLPLMIFASFMTLWMGLTIIRWITYFTIPAKPEFDIHSPENTFAWLKYHAGDYKDKAVDMRDSLSARAATFLAQHDFDRLKSGAIDYRDIGLRWLGLQEPTWSEWAWAKLLGRPITWQDRVNNVLDLAKDGINRVDLKSGGLFDRVKHMLHPEPTLYESVRDNIPGLRQEGLVDGMKHKLQDGIDTVRSHLPGGESIESLRQRAYEATHPSTLDQLKSGAEYIKNRVVHGAQEAVHIAQDRANEASDKFKYKTGL